MAYTLENTERVIHNIIIKLLESDDLMKCLKYDVKSALEEDDLTDGEKMILAMGNPQYARILQMPVNPDTVEENRVELRVYIDKIIPDNIHLADINISLQVVVSNNLWMLDNGIQRPLKMISEVLKVLNGELVEGLGRLYFQRPIQFVTYNKSYSGYILTPDVRMG